MKIIGIERIREVLAAIDLIPEIEAAFVAYSEGRAVVPPVGELLFEDPPGDVHIKYGYLKHDDYYVVKIASGFYGNPSMGLPSGNGLMLLFSQKTGEPLGILLDQGYLTDVRTAVAGAVACRYLAPRDIRRIGIVGTGVQARMQLRRLAEVTDCRQVLAWGRDRGKLRAYCEELSAEGFAVEGAPNPAALAAECNLIVTATAAREPLLWADQIRKGTHITAMGSDTAGKQELDPEITGMADLVVADSIWQCLERGETAHAIRAGIIESDDVVELGAVIAGRAPSRTSEEQITVADLTGVAVQDLQIARCVYEACLSAEGN